MPVVKTTETSASSDADGVMLAPAELQRIATLPYRPAVIVCPFDPADMNHAGLRAACALAERLDAKLRVVHVLHNPLPPPMQPEMPALMDFDQEWRAARDAVEDSLEHLLAETVAGHDVDAEIEIAVGIHYKEIVRYAEKVHADLIVMSTHGGHHGLAEKLLGSTAERVIRLVSCPVLAIPPEAVRSTPHRVVVATDFSLFADEALPVVQFFVAAFDPEVIFAHVLSAYRNPAVPSAKGAPPPLVREWRESMREAARGDLAARAQTIESNRKAGFTVLEGRDAGKEIVAFAEEKNADLIISGTRGNSGLPRLLLGSTAEEIVRRAHCATLTVTPGFFDRMATGAEERRASTP